MPTRNHYLAGGWSSPRRWCKHLGSSQGNLLCWQRFDYTATTWGPRKKIYWVGNTLTTLPLDFSHLIERPDYKHREDQIDSSGRMGKSLKWFACKIYHKKIHAPATENRLCQSQLQGIISAFSCNICHQYVFHNWETEGEASEEQPNEHSNLQHAICRTISKEVQSNVRAEKT